MVKNENSEKQSNTKKSTIKYTIENGQKTVKKKKLSKMVKHFQQRSEKVKNGF